ncbi:Probable nicotinate-nucleotide pyrophosphorylase [carboxylating] [Alloiococcus otitis]|uniref:Probable nicotinate-nucleotide pyrophosphorylase [carboxylating] n=1 Tax=Alloiococcus otitis ATCC 51267 TaxID=883081 RepID=K9EBR8_9LACT|nr:carboxylating nicotinate-nucleotide diphosphorylase [Alloiococcus otitis]EKU94128.1 nicotinate-nucleotide diphosphorylase (carboxylating) [Alloiococcus otitis ATCC 51267]SUU81239.1 Probable nicotinate-nucleotide pyrophosphorylase [carboxylating] [Alloiococcus otitis]
MTLYELKNFQIDQAIQLALKEDINYEDVTSNAIYTEDRLAEISLLAKGEGILAGLAVFKRVFQLLDDQVTFKDYKQEGDWVKDSDLVLEVQARVSTLLSGERVALNYLQRMSGIATNVARYVAKLDDDSISVVDTRKTTPNMRVFEKYAVKVGGGFNHRYNLSDGILIKDNHIDAAGSIKEAVAKVRDYTRYVKKIEVEVESLEGVQEALEAQADIIMLDNMAIDSIREAVKLIDKQAIIECSGNIDLSNVKDYQNLGIDYLSSGAMVYNAPVLDLSMKNLTYLKD